MCGIAGFISHTDFDVLRNELPGSLSALAHRGPDDAGLYFDAASGVGLAHRRLSIIDLSAAGHQPMTDKTQSLQIVYNGEIYNFKKIRKELRKKGYEFHSATDTEVVLYAYLEWGVECLNRFIGMFAFAIWDKNKKIFFLARDRLGIKPFYYYKKANTLVFASELKAIMALSVFPKEIDEAAIPLFLHYQYVPTPHSIFKNTYKLPPASYLLYRDGDVSVKSYWSAPAYENSNRSKDQHDEHLLVEKLDQVLTQAVSDRLVSDVPLGALLSGGIDSSIVVALMQKVNASPVRTFSIGFKDDRYDEAPWAKKIASHLGTAHTELYVDSREALDVIPHLPTIYDEPFADSSSIPTFLVSRMARKQVTVALSGDGGDEQFAGYMRYWMTLGMEKWVERLPIRPDKFFSLAVKLIRPHWVEKCYLPIRNLLPRRFQITNIQDKWQKLLSVLQHDQISEIYRRTICIWDKDELFGLVGLKLPNCRFDQAFNETKHWPILQRLMHVDQQTYLSDCMLTKVDRASMANGLEVRVPLLDHRVVEFSARLPAHFKLRNGRGKYLLKKVLGKYIPTELFERPKMGLGIPIARWLRGPLKPLLLDYLSHDRLKKEGLFNQFFIDQIIEEHLSGQYNHQHRLWAVLMWQMWREKWAS